MDVNSNYPPEKFVCTIIGNQNVGKSTLLYTLQHGNCPTIKLNRLVEPFEKTISSTTLRFEDSAGSDDLAIIRPMLYRNTDLFIICFSTVVKKSSDDILKTWLPEISKHRYGAPFVFVGTQTDLRDQESDTNRSDNKLNFKPDCKISYEEGKRMAKQFRAMAYYEYSSQQPNELSELPAKLLNNIMQSLEKQQKGKK